MTDAVGQLQEDLRGFEQIDLGHLLEPGMPSWPTHTPYGHDVLESLDHGDDNTHYRIVLDEHTGTHLDAPLHFVAGAAAVDEIGVEQFFGRALAIEVADADPGSGLSREVITRWEDDHCAIEPGDAVLFHFGWDGRWGRQDFLRDWPGLSPEAARYLVGRGVRMVGTDALSVDAFESADFAAHRTLLGGEVLIAENVNRVGELPAVSYLIAVPLPIAAGSGSPVRPIALVPRRP